MKIIQIIPQLSSGGGERFTVDLTNELALRGHEVILCVLHTLHEGSSGFYSPDVSKQVKIVSMDKRKGLDIGLFWRLFRFLRDERPDVIHTHLRAIVYATIAERFVVRGVHTVHSDASKEASEWFSRAIRNWLFRNGYVQPVTISPESRESFLNFYGFDAPLICNGRNIPEDLVVSESVKAECDSYRRDKDTRLIVHLAHIDEVKRQLLHARVAKRLFDEGYNFAVLFIGSDKRTDYVNAVRAVMPPCCHILGQRQNPLEYLKEAGAYALCSLYEGLPISLIETLGVGSLPICTPVGGIVNLVQDGENGILSKDLEEESFYQAMKRYLQMSENEILQMRRRAKKSYTPFSMTECAEKYEEIYCSVINLSHPNKWPNV